ncbi:LysR family transcriptional regulator [Petroclostridium sp. X23]|uniref:LysR family transcriptional regulator n=1 Tax=Petroclostridium sp. X23 TaxID=3045146 RepID=UPI0024ACD8A2|nr:LysR family transcriptional regulator [Petroclostridium sp. X23]WHH61208.1 LysR family transcriptional regulator [Petroclostridium sp. X23]
MTERELLYVKTIAEEKSISKAAQKLFLTQPSLSKCIQKIESDLGTKLFKRTNTGLLPTFAGERYYQIATDILKIYNDFEIEVCDINNLKKGKITIGFTANLATHLLPATLPPFKAAYPNIDVHIVEETSTGLEKALSSGKIDFAVMHTNPFYDPINDSNIVYHLLYRDHFILVTKKDHPLGRHAVEVPDSKHPRIDLTLFANEPFILVSRGQRIRQMSDAILQKANINPLIVLTTKSYETARRLACEGICVTLVPQQYVEIFTVAYSPAYYSIEDKYSPYWSVCVATQKNSYLSKAAQQFIKMLGEKCGCTTLES